MTLSSDSPASIPSATNAAIATPVTAASTTFPPGMSARRAGGVAGDLRSARSAGGGMAVAADRGGDGDGQQRGEPDRGFDDGPGGGAAEAQRAQRAGDDGDGVGLGEGLQPARHGRHGHEDRAGEEQDDDREDPGQPGGLRIADGQAEQQVKPGERGPCHHGQPDGGGRGAGSGVEPEADGHPDAGQQQDEQVPRRVRGDPAGQDRGSADGQGPEPVDHPGADVLGDGDPGLGGAEPERQDEDARQQVVDVAGGAGDVDSAAEGVGEQQDEQHRLQGREYQQRGHADQPPQITAGDDGDGGDRSPGPSRVQCPRWGGDGSHDVLRSLAASCGGPGSATPLAAGVSPWELPVSCPVRARKASSSAGLRSASSLTFRPASASRRATSGRMAAPSATGSTTRPAASSTVGSPAPSAATAAASRRGSMPGAACRSSRSPPARALSSSGVPRAITRPRLMMTIAAASRSASSMYWVVSSRLAPSAVSCPRTCHSASRPAGSRPVVGSSRNSTGGAAIRLAATSRRRRMPPE